MAIKAIPDPKEQASRYLQDAWESTGSTVERINYYQNAAIVSAIIYVGEQLEALKDTLYLIPDGRDN